MSRLCVCFTYHMHEWTERSVFSGYPGIIRAYEWVDMIPCRHEAIRLKFREKLINNRPVGRVTAKGQGMEWIDDPCEDLQQKKSKSIPHAFGFEFDILSVSSSLPASFSTSCLMINDPFSSLFLSPFPPIIPFCMHALFIHSVTQNTHSNSWRLHAVAGSLIIYPLVS